MNTSDPQPKNTVPGQDELLPCPFCGASPQVLRNDELRWTPLAGCRLCTMGWKTFKQWNTRAIPGQETDELRWIPITERLPQGSREVLYWDGEEVSTFFPETGHKEVNQALARCARFGITHWMPFPDPPSDSSRPKFEDASGSIQEPNIGGDCDHGYPAGHNCPHCEPSQKGGVVGQPSLSEVLKGWDENRNAMNLSRDIHDIWRRAEIVIPEHAALVKALRRTLGILKEFKADPFVVQAVENSVTSILTSAGDKKGEGFGERNPNSAITNNPTEQATQP